MGQQPSGQPRASVSSGSLSDRIDDLLPQTQCGQCGFPACRPYAEALANGATDLNRCPPGGDTTIGRLAALLQRPALALDPDCGPARPPQLAIIDEAHCIGCTKCIQACPVDAIAGAAKLMHTVLTEECSGCALCLPPCPVDCIVLRPLANDAWTEHRAAKAKHRYQARQQRLQRQIGERQAKRTRVADPLQPATLDIDSKQRLIAQAIARAKAKRAAIARGEPGASCSQ